MKNIKKPKLFHLLHRLPSPPLLPPHATNRTRCFSLFFIDTDLCYGPNRPDLLSACAPSSCSFIAQNKHISLRADELEENANDPFSLEITHQNYVLFFFCFLLIRPYWEFDLTRLKHLFAFSRPVVPLRRLISDPLLLLLLLPPAHMITLIALTLISAQ